MMRSIAGKEYIEFLNEIKSRILTARIQAIRSVNKELIQLYWDIGKSIVERQKQFGWGKGVVEQLSRDLTNEYANFEGFSRDNLWRMRMFYLEYKDEQKLAQLVPELPWGHNILIMQKVKNIKEREYYVTSGIKLGWSRNVLLNQIKANAYALSQRQETHNFPKVLPVHLAEQAEKDNIVVEYALRSVKKPVGVAEYYLTKKLPRYLAGKLPDANALKMPIQEELK
ncbi:MAG: DUF1016 N-terminal domain-containing protein [Candidatus Omnitrophica bacterium]|nr:DUF1016 N-terminal domain-containing protein [Candidatus Omnitrophota bacterium]